MFRSPASNPYLIDGRLADVVAAITALANYKFYKLNFDEWAKRISGLTKDGCYWENVFRQHPEFFRIDTEDQQVSLVWRRQYAKVFDVDSGKLLNLVDSKKFTESRLSRQPLSSVETTALIGVAIDMHERALDHSKASKWWVPILAGAFSLVGAFIGSWLKSG